MPKDYIEPFSESLSKSVTGDLYAEAKKFFAKLDLGDLKLEDYRNGILNAYGHVQIMGMPSPRKLENIYVGLRAVPDQKKNLRRVDSKLWKPQDERRIVQARKFLHHRERFNIDKFISELGYEDTDDGRTITTATIQDEKDTLAITDEINSTKSAGRPLSAVDFVTNFKKLIVLGQPGSGKTTFLKYLALVFSGHIQTITKVDYRLPILVPLREVKRLGNPNPTADWLSDLALSCASDISTRAFGKEWLEGILQKGHCLILLDGVDEAPLPLLNVIFQSIRAFAAKYRKNSIVITCRAAAFERSIEGFQICEVDDFTNDDITLFISQWYGTKQTAEAARLTRDIFGSNLAKDLCRTPLLLTLICILYGYRRSIPANRAELYEACVDALLFRWDTFRSIDRDPLIEASISPDRKKLLLSRVAYRAFAKNVIYFNGALLRELIQTELDHVNLGSVPAEFLLKEIESHNGLLVEYSPGIYCFSHLTFHEFFTALYYQDTKDFDELFQKTVTEPRYLEVFLMCIEKAYNADELMIQIISHINNVCLLKRRYNEYLHELVRWILHCDVVMNEKLRRVLEDMSNRLEQIEIDDQSEIAISDLKFEDDE